MRIRLKEACEFAGRVYQRGEEVILPDGMKGPMRAQRRGQDRIDYSTNPAIDANRDLGQLVDVPLYDVVEGTESLDHTPEQRKEADAAADASKPPKQEQPIVPPEVVPVPSYPPGEVRALTHIEERESR